MFTFEKSPGRTVLLFDGDPILSLVDEHLWFRGFRVEKMKFRPRGPVELMGLAPSAFYGFNLLRGDVSCRRADADGACITLKPVKADGNLLDLVQEEREYLVEYLPDRGRFRWTITCRIDFLQDIRGDEKGLYLTGMQKLQEPGSNQAAIEFDDPMLSGGIGPQVPMVQDWTGLPEPEFAAEQFTTRWKKRYLSVTLPTVARGLRKLVFNREANCFQRFFNRVIPRMTPRQPFVYEKTDGHFLQFTPLHDYPSSHHICEWGYDMHWYALLDRPAAGLLFQKGQHVELSYQLEEIERAGVPAAYLEAPLAEIEPEERAKADMPIYEEPVCRFTRSALDCPDNYGWTAGERCVWNRGGGRAPGTGALEIHNGSSARDAAWQFGCLGPSYGCNPIPPASRFKVSAWVRADELDTVSCSLTLNHYDGPGMFGVRVPIVSNASGRDCCRREGNWSLLEFVSEKAGAFTLDGGFRFAYSGGGTAALAELRVERL